MAGADKSSIAVICTFRSAEQSLPAMLGSLEAQDYRNFRCILVNDDSRDRGPDIVRDIARRDPRFVSVENAAPGRGRALNLALSLANEDFVAILDADDVAHPAWLKHMMDYATSADFAAIGCRLVAFSDDEKLKWPSLANPAAGRLEDATRDLCRLNPIGHSGVVSRRAALARAGHYDESRQMQLDYDLWVRLALAGERIGRIGLPLIGKRIHQDQHFERGRRYRYLRESARVQLRAIRGIDSSLTNYGWWLARLMWGCLPQRVRIALRMRARGNI